MGLRTLEGTLDDQRRMRRPALVPFVTGGFPTPATCLPLLCALADAGADAIELGIPFSDPLADGPTIQKTSQEALAAGVRVRDVLAIARAFRDVSDVPVVIMTYANPMLRAGVHEFAVALRDAGVAGILVTDLPPTELPQAWHAIRAAGLSTIPLIAPTTPEERVPSLVHAASGFVYCVSRTGVTGKGQSFSTRLPAQLAAIRAQTSLPILVGFGVRSRADVSSVFPASDGVVVGAALLEVVRSAPDVDAGIEAGARFLRSLREEAS